MKFSELFAVDRVKEEDWFDPILTLDTRLFLDPFLLYSDEMGVFQGSHSDIIAFFNSVFKLIATSGGDQSSPHWRRALGLLQFPEVPELCLGYTGAGTRGSGSGGGLARLIAGALWEAVQAGLTELRHFEEIGILRQGIGADRISDITAGLIRRRLAEYTTAICKAHKVPLQKVNLLRGSFDVATRRWTPFNIRLPKNPYNGRAILLVPRRYLRSLPTVNADDFWDYSFDHVNETLRAEFSEDVTRNVDKGTIVEFARRHPEVRAQYIASLDSRRADSYDFSRDEQGVVRWYDEAAQYCENHPLGAGVQTAAEFDNAIDSMLQEFKHFVEENAGWRLLVNDNGVPRGEQAAQLLCLGTVIHYCRSKDIDVTREANIGRGPVDFKVARGYRLRALIEVKLAKNTRFWNGLEQQLPTYLQAERVDRGYFIVIMQSDGDLRRVLHIQNRIAAVRKATGLRIDYVGVDARRPPSASTL